MAPKDELTPLDVTLREVLQRCKPLSVEALPLEDAHGRVLAADAHADADQPAFDRAAMDGIAVRASDCTEPGSELRDIGESPAGTPFSSPIAAGTCVRIMTGGVVPPGADAVVPIERLVRLDGGWRVLDPARPEQHIARRGSEVRTGDVVVSAGNRLNGARIGVLASFGHTTVTCHRRPRVAMLPTGNEIVPIGATPGPGQVRDANRHALTGLLLQAGARVAQHAVGLDKREDLRQAMENAWRDADVLVLSGGVSAGDYDLVPLALQDLGATAHVHKIRIKPGKPFLFATLGDKLAFGLPGNPISSYVCCALFVLPALAALQGMPNPGWHTVTVPTHHALPAAGPRTEILPAQLVAGTLGLVAGPLGLVAGTLGLVAGPQGARVQVLPVRGSADLAHFAQADWMVVRPAGSPAIAAGEPVEVLVQPRP